MANDLAPVKGLTEIEREIARLMVDGLDHDETILGEHVPAFCPLTLVQAAKSTGYKIRKARNHLGDLAEFNAYRGKLLRGRRENEAARNLHTAIEIRDDDGDGSAAIKTVRLKAIGVIEGKPDGASVTVNVNQTSNNVVAGYVIRLPAPRAEAAPMIAHDRAE